MIIINFKVRIGMSEIMSIRGVKKKLLFIFYYLEKI